MPVNGVRNTALKRAEYCAVHNKLMLDYIVGDPDLEVVVIFAFWNSYAEARDYANGAGVILKDELVAVPTGAADDLPDAQRIPAVAGLMRADLQALVAAGKRVVILGPLPQPGFNLPDRLARDIWLGRDPAPRWIIPEAAFADYAVAAQGMLRAAASGLEGVSVLDLSPLFCAKGGNCQMVLDGRPLFFDGNHLSLAGSALVAEPLADAVQAASAAGDN